MEAAIGPLLEELGYGLSTSDEKRKRAGGRTRLSAYGALWNTRHWLKNATPLGRWFSQPELPPARKQPAEEEVPHFRQSNG
jgi:hypothetical protein